MTLVSTPCESVLIFVNAPRSIEVLLFKPYGSVRVQACAHAPLATSALASMLFCRKLASLVHMFDVICM